MVYHLSGGSRDYDPTLGELPSNSFVEMNGDRGKVLVTDPTPDGGGLITYRSKHVGRPVVVDENIPTKLRRTGPGIKRAKLLDVHQTGATLDLVNQRFKDIIDEYEPNIHQFFPTEYYDSKGKEKIGDGYWMIICQRLDTLHDTLCFPPRDEKGFIDEFNEKYKGRDLSLDRKVFSKEKVAGHHMWHDKYTLGTLFSNELAERLLSANFTGMKYIYYDEA